jgi:hypothetical protein
MDQRHIWCSSCGGISVAEALLESAEFVSARTVPQRCLRCGNLDISVPSSFWADLEHEPCGGMLRCTADIVGGTEAFRMSPHRYSVNGELLELGCRWNPLTGEERPLELWWLVS